VAALSGQRIQGGKKPGELKTGERGFWNNGGRGNLTIGRNRRGRWSKRRTAWRLVGGSHEKIKKRQQVPREVQGYEEEKGGSQK